MKGRKHITRFTIVMVMAVLAVGVFAGAALASDDANVSLAGGTLGVTGFAVPDFTGYTLDGAAHVLKVQPATFTVTDATGLGAGWQVQVTAHVMTNAGYVVGQNPAVNVGKNLDANALELLAIPAPTKVDDTSSAIPSIIDRTSKWIDSGSAITIASAAADGTGMGAYLFTPPADSLVLHVPAKAYAGAYHTTLIIDTISGPYDPD